jgi:hypothetical protein
MDRKQAVTLMQEILLCTKSYFDSFEINEPNTVRSYANGYTLHLKGVTAHALELQIKDYLECNGLRAKAENGIRIYEPV